MPSLETVSFLRRAAKVLGEIGSLPISNRYSASKDYVPMDSAECLGLARQLEAIATQMEKDPQVPDPPAEMLQKLKEMVHAAEQARGE